MVELNVNEIKTRMGKAIESFKKDLNLLKNNKHFPEYFQSIRKKNERLGFGDFILKSNRINSDDKEILSLLGFKIQDG